MPAGRSSSPLRRDGWPYNLDVECCRQLLAKLHGGVLRFDSGQPAGKLAEIGLKTRWSQDDQAPGRSTPRIPEGVRMVLWHNHMGAGSNFDRRVVPQKTERPHQDIEALVSAMVDVHRWAR